MTQPSELRNAPDEMTRLLNAAGEALTDQMVERAATTASNALDVLDRLNDEETRDAIHSLIDQVTALHRNGGLVPLFETLHLVNAIRNALTDSMVERLAAFAEHMAANLANEDVATLADRACSATAAAVAETRGEQPAQGGMLAAMRLLSQPETQSSLRFLLSFARHFKTQNG